jgi:hypothetical protein
MDDKELNRRLELNRDCCPSCYSANLCYFNDDENADQITLEVLCSECECSWLEHYEYKSASNFELGKLNE